MDKETLTRFDDIAKKFENVKTVEEHQQLEAEWWATAIGAFNEHIAGTITLADGRTIETPTI